MKTLNTEELEISLYQQNDTTVVSVQGEVDLSTVAALHAALEEGASQVSDGENPTARMAVELRQVTFIDSAGLALLVKVWKQFEDSWQLTLIVEPNSQPERVLKLGRFDQFFRVLYKPDDL